MTQKSISLQEAFSLFITASAKGKRTNAGGYHLHPKVVTHYHHVQKSIADFEATTQNPLAIQFVSASAAGKWQTQKRYWKRFLEDYQHYGRQTMQWSDNYIKLNITVIKSVFNFLAQAKGLPVGNFHKDFHLQSWQAPPLVIMPQRLQWLIANKAFRQSLAPCLLKVLDTVIIGCTVGLRFKDLMALRPVHLETTPGCTYLITTTSKTATPVRIPLPAYADIIIKKYYRKTNKKLLPQLSNSQFNKQFKNLGKLAGWTEEVPKYRSMKGRKTELKNKAGKTWKFYEHLAAHTMRRTAITTLLLLGVEEAVVRTISGHTPASKEFYRYVAFVQGYLDKQVKKAHQLLIENPNCYLD